MTYLSNKADSIVPYIPGDQPQDKKYIKINTNENPYPPAKEVFIAIQVACNEQLRLYPDPESTNLRNAIAKREGLNKEQVFVGNSSDEVLALAFLAFFNPTSCILFPDITYSFYSVYAELYNIPYKTIPLNENFTLDNDAYLQDNGGIIFPNPNAPTGIFKPLAEIEELLSYNLDKAVVIIDEAYIEFGGESALPLLSKFANLLLIRTFSKSHSLAGMRLGYALGSPELINGLTRIKNSFNSYPVDYIAANAGKAAIEAQAYYTETSKRIIITREKTRQALEKMGFNCLPSKANFLFISHISIKATTLFAYLKDNDILVRYFNKPRLDNFLRVTIGTDAEMQFFLAKLKLIIEQ
ncbi:MAG: histidinol-phosphate transaminase [Clostridia bacterium]